MYDTFFGLNKHPFSPAPQTDRYYPATSVEAARIALIRCIERGEGVGVIIGPTGTGKTLLCRLLAEHFKKSFPVAEMLCGRLSSRRSLYQAILYSLGQPYRGMDEGELRLALVDYLTLGKAPQGMVLIVDEAHTLPLRLLDEIRMLTNLFQQGQPLVRLLLAANGSLEERLAGPKMDSFNQRISARCYLEALGRAETQDYIQTQIDWAGGSGAKIFPEDACQSVYQAADGVPRLINQLCDHALLVAYVAGRKTIAPANIEEAWADLQQLPTPWNGDNQHEQGGVIEFGRFDDADESSTQASSEGAAVPSLRVADDFEQYEAEFAKSAAENGEFQPASIQTEEEFQPEGTDNSEMELVFDDADHPFQEEFEHEEIITDRYAGAGAPLSPILQSQAEAPAIDQPENSKKAGEMPNLDYEKTRPLHQGVPECVECTGLPANVLEKEPDALPSKPRAISTVRRHEYSRLFAKLRRG